MSKSKYLETCKIIKDGQDENSQYEKESRKFIEKLCQIIKEDWEIPNNNYSVISVNQEKYDVILEQKDMFLASDTYWHFGIKIEFYDENIEMRPIKSIFHFRFKKIKEAYLVKITDEDKGFEVEYNNDGNYHEYSKYLFNFLSADFKNSLEDFLLNKNKELKIGFNVIRD